MEQSSYLDAVAERVVVFDGAFGTYMQDLELGPDDFGGPALEGCNEMLCLTRPDVIAGMHRAFFDVGVDVVETASFGSFSIVLNEYDVADKAHELNVAAGRHRPRGRRRATPPTAAPASSPARSAPAPSCRASATSASPTCATPTRSRRPGCSRVASTCS